MGSRKEAGRLSYGLVIDPIKGQLRKLKRRDKTLYEQIAKKLEQIQRHPEVGDPKAYPYKGFRSVHIGPYVLLYRVQDRTITLTKLDHHDKVYKSG